MITIICGKSASGKDTLLKELKENFGFRPIVSTTSRPMRDGETDGVDYNFTSRSAFEAMVSKGELAEYRAYSTLVGGVPDVWYYGTTKHSLESLDPDKNYAMVMDLEGANKIRDSVGSEACRVIYLDTPDKLRTKRAKARGSFDETEWNRRLADDNERFSDKTVADIADGLIIVGESDTPEALAVTLITMIEPLQEDTLDIE